MNEAYFDANGICLGVTDGPLPGGDFIFNFEVPYGTKPDDIWTDGAQVLPREDHGGSLPEEVLVGEVVQFNEPPNTKVIVNGEMLTPVDGVVQLDTSVEQRLVVMLKGRFRALRNVDVVSTDTQAKVAERAAIRLHQVVNATPQQIDNYIDNNVTDLASARTFLKLLTRLVVYGIKN